jgi:hemerythrin
MTKYSEVDILLLNHEKEEEAIMAKYGYDALKAHRITEKKYDWDVKIKELD